MALEQAADVEVLVVLGDAVCQVAQRIRRDVDSARAQPVLLAGEERPVVTEDVRDRVGHLLSSVWRPSLARSFRVAAGASAPRARKIPAGIAGRTDFLCSTSCQICSAAHGEPRNLWASTITALSNPNSKCSVSISGLPV